MQQAAVSSTILAIPVLKNCLLVTVASLFSDYLPSECVPKCNRHELYCCQICSLRQFCRFINILSSYIFYQKITIPVARNEFVNGQCIFFFFKFPDPLCMFWHPTLKAIYTIIQGRGLSLYIRTLFFFVSTSVT